MKMLLKVINGAKWILYGAGSLFLTAFALWLIVVVLKFYYYVAVSAWNVF